MAGPDADFWQQRFIDGKTPWDRRSPHPQLAAWAADGLFGSGTNVVVPGCGSGHDVLALASIGCQVIAVDYAPAAVDMVRSRLAAAGLSAEVKQADVLEWQPGKKPDVVLEQTCLCALHPDHWAAYARQLSEWLPATGRLAALFMQALRSDAVDGRVTGPPYHCDINAMRALFPARHWHWPPPPYPQIPHPTGNRELAVVLTRR